MEEGIVSLYAPLLSAGDTVEEALGRGQKENSLAIVEQAAGGFRLHPIEELERAAQGAPAEISLGGLSGQYIVEVLGQPAQVKAAALLAQLGEDIAILRLVQRAGGVVAEVIGFESRGYVPSNLSITYYQCATAGCTDRRRYRGPGLCSYSHPLVKRP